MSTDKGCYVCDEETKVEIHYRCGHWLCYKCHIEMVYGSVEILECPWAECGEKMFVTSAFKGTGGGQIWVRDLEGRTISLCWDPERMTVLDLKCIVHSILKLNWNARMMILIHAGRNLADDSLLKDCGITDYATLHFILRLRGD